MNNKGLLACLAIILASGATVAARTTARAAGVSLPSPGSVPARVDASKLSVARRTATPTPSAAPATDGSLPRQPAPLTAGEWQHLRASVASLTNRPLATMAVTLTDSADLSAPGNRITLTPRSIPPDTKLSFHGPTFVRLSPSTSTLAGQEGARVNLEFPAVAGAVYLVSCSLSVEVEYRFSVHTKLDMVSFDGNAKPQADGSTHMVWAAPADMTGGRVYVNLRPIGLPSYSVNGSYYRILDGCDVLRAS